MHIIIALVNIDAPQQNFNQEVLTPDLSPDMTIDDLKGYIESETGVKNADQRIYHKNRELDVGSQTLQQCEVLQDDMLAMQVRSNGGGQYNRGSARPAQGQQRSPEDIRHGILGDPRQLAQVQLKNPDLANAIHDPGRFRQVLDGQRQRQAALESERLRREDLLAADPFNVEAQREIEEMIREEQVMENLQNAVEYNPEVFGRVHMLYIPVEVNQFKIKAFVDSGAQTTIMSPSCAEQSGILRLLDKRFAGVARGVGTAKILGRVHSAQIRIGNTFLACSFTVMEGKDVDLLLGLDMLKKHQANIDLGRNKLIIQGEEIDFLGEADIPKTDELLKDEPTVPGPPGTMTGAISGTVVPANPPVDGGQRERPASALATEPSTQRTQAVPSGPSSQQSTTGPASFPKESIEQLTRMGFTIEESIHALEVAGGNVEAAAGFLL